MIPGTRKHWPLVRFKEVVAHSAFGPRFSGELYSEAGNVATLRTTDLSTSGKISYSSMPLAQIDENRFSNHFLRVGDLVISRSGRIGTTAVFKGFELPVLPGAFLIRFRLCNDALPEFYRYFFNSATGQALIRSVARGAAQQNINISNVELLCVPRPATREQEEIVDILSAYDELIENNRRRIALLEEAARLLYREWFVHFRFPGHEHVKRIDGIPDGWKRRMLIELAEVVMGQSPKSQFYNQSGEGLPFHQGVTDYGHRFVSHRVYSSAVTKVANARDILVSVRAPVGRINITRDKIVLGRGLAAIRSRTGHQAFLFYALKSHFYAEDIIGTGAIYAATNKKQLEGQVFLEPPGLLLREFEDRADAIDLQIACLSDQNLKLAKARDLLLPRLMNGEIAV